MKNETPGKLLAVLVGLCLTGLLTLTQCQSEPASPKGTTPMSQSPGVKDTTREPAATRVPTRTPTEAQMAVNALQQLQESSCDSSCQATLEAERWHVEYGEGQQIVRPEWESLFPGTRFYLVPWTNFYQGTSAYGASIFALHQGQWHDADGLEAVKVFALLSDAYNIEITAENYELAAKSFALMTIPAYLGEEVVFTEWVEFVENDNYDYYLKAWTKIGGVEVAWAFNVQNKRFKDVSVGHLRMYVGDYIPGGPQQPPRRLFYFPPR